MSVTLDRGAKLVFMFSGQGTQFEGIAIDLYHRSVGFREVVDRGSHLSGLPLYDLLAGRVAVEGVEALHAALFAYCTGVAAHLAEQGIMPSVVMGHSLGEYSALVVGGCLGWEDGMRLVMERGRLMAEACSAHPGVMAAITGLAADRVCSICRTHKSGVVVIANYNSPVQTVISGQEPVVASVSTMAEEAGALVTPLPVAGAFHSPLMSEAERQYAGYLANISLRPPRVPLISSLTGEVVTNVAEYQQALRQQMTHPVLWVDAVRTALEENPSAFIEVGPGHVLCGILRQNQRSAVASTFADLVLG